MGEANPPKGTREGNDATPTRELVAGNDGKTIPIPAPITLGRVQVCLGSAEFWAKELLPYANNRRRWADWFAIAAGTLAAVTGVAIWPALTETSEDWEKWLVSTAAVLAALFALFPRVKNYAELASQAREHASQYGLVYGQLMDLENAYRSNIEIDPRWAQHVIDEFEKIKAKKDMLRDLRER